MKKLMLASTAALALGAFAGSAQAATNDATDVATAQSDAQASESANRPQANVITDSDIVVTANRTESLASKTPLALTAISGDALARAGVTTTAGLADQIPNLVLASSNGGLQITIRGVTNEEATERGDPSAAFLIDNVYIARPQAVEVGLFDIARVEALRGPQGTLFGRNTTAGLVHIVTNRPTFEFGGSADVSYGNYNAFLATGVINVPVSENFALRAAVNYDRRDNYLIRGPNFTGHIDPFKENISGRLQGLYRWETGEVIIRGDYTDFGGRPYDILALNTFYTPTTVGVDPQYRNQSTKRQLTVNAPMAVDVFRNNKTWGIGGELTQELGPVDLTYVGSYRNFDRFEADPKINAIDASFYRLEWKGKFEQQQHELRFATNGTGPLKAQVGGYFFHEDIQQQLRLLLVPNSLQIGNTVFFDTRSLVNRSYAFFGQATYSLTDNFRITAGIRYSNDSKKRPDSATFLCDRFDCTGTVTQTSTNIAKAQFSKTTWRAGFDYDLNASLLLFGSVATGYKAGGFNDGCEIGVAPGCRLAPGGLYFRPETLTSYEGGLKGRLAPGVRFSLNAFHYDYTDIQLFQLIADCGGGASCAATTNGGKAKVSGIEFESTLSPSPNDRFDFGVNYLDAHFTDFRPDAIYNFSGRPLSRAPKWTLNAGFEHTQPLRNGGDIRASVRTRLSDEYFFLSIAARNYYRQPSFTRTDATITYNAPDNQYYVQAFVQNIENSLPATRVEFGTRSAVQTQSPRTYGVRAGLKF